mgnify:FL=1
MIKEKHIYNNKFIYSCLISLICTFIRFIIYSLILAISNGRYLLGNLISYIISFAILFYWNQKLFDSKPCKKKEEMRQLLLFILFRILGFFIDSAFLIFFVEKLKLSKLISIILSSLVTFIYNHKVNRKYVFKNKTL